MGYINVMREEPRSEAPPKVETAAELVERLTPKEVADRHRPRGNEHGPGGRDESKK
jgi:hypothetical protein